MLTSQPGETKIEEGVRVSGSPSKAHLYDLISSHWAPPFITSIPSHYCHGLKLRLQCMGL